MSIREQDLSNHLVIENGSKVTLILSFLFWGLLSEFIFVLKSVPLIVFILKEMWKVQSIYKWKTSRMEHIFFVGEWLSIDIFAFIGLSFNYASFG